MIHAPMTLKVPKYLWDELGLDDPEMNKRILCGYFMGYGPEAIRQLAERAPDSKEVRELLRVAPLMGLTDEDRLISK